MLHVWIAMMQLTITSNALIHDRCAESLVVEWKWQNFYLVPFKKLFEFQHRKPFEFGARHVPQYKLTFIWRRINCVILNELRLSSKRSINNKPSLRTAKPLVRSISIDSHKIFSISSKCVLSPWDQNMKSLLARASIHLYLFCRSSVCRFTR